MKMKMNCRHYPLFYSHCIKLEDLFLHEKAETKPDKKNICCSGNKRCFSKVDDAWCFFFLIEIISEPHRLEKSHCHWMQEKSQSQVVLNIFTKYLELLVGHLMEKKRQKRVTKQGKECNLAMILICTVVTFFFFHMPRYSSTF